MKKLLAIFACVLLLCAMIPLGAIPMAAATSGKTGDCTWTLDGTHLTISGNGEMEEWYDSTYSNGSWITSAPWGASIQSVTIEDSVTSIGGGAFYNCASLTSVTISNSVTSIGNYAFTGCTSLTSVTIPDSVTSIGGRVFVQCTSLTSVTIGDSVTSIGYYAFAGCTSLTSVTIPDSVTAIDESTFLDCTSLTSVTIGDGVTSIGYEAFYNCTSLTDVYYEGDQSQRANISIGSGNTDLTSATWHYNICIHRYDNTNDATCNVCGAVRAVADCVGMSVSEDVSGLAMLFKPEVEGIVEKADAYMQADYTNATYHGYKLLELGVVASNGVCETTIKGENVYEWKDGAPTFAFRIIDIPADKLDVVITMTPYYVVEIDGVETTIYGTAQAGAYADVAN